MSEIVVTDEEIHRRFRRRGLRVTPQRLAIYAALVGRLSHPTAEQLLVSVRRRAPRISVNTVYYTLEALRNAGLVQEVNYGHDRARFDGNLAPHHHLICRRCRRIVDVSDRTLDRLRPTRAIPKDFQITGHRVEVYGFCAACRGLRVPRQNRRRSQSSPGRTTRR